MPAEVQDGGYVHHPGDMGGPAEELVVAAEAHPGGVATELHHQPAAHEAGGMLHGVAGRAARQRGVDVERKGVVDGRRLVAGEHEVVAADELRPRARRCEEEALETVGGRPVIGILEQVGVEVGGLDDLLDQSVGPDIGPGREQRDAGEASHDVLRRLRRGVVDDDDAVDRPALSRQRCQAVLQPRLAGVVGDEGEYPGVDGQAACRAGLGRLIRNRLAGAWAFVPADRCGRGGGSHRAAPRCSRTVVRTARASRWASARARAARRCRS